MEKLREDHGLAFWSPLRSRRIRRRFAAIQGLVSRMDRDRRDADEYSAPRIRQLMPQSLLACWCSFLSGSCWSRCGNGLSHAGCRCVEADWESGWMSATESAGLRAETAPGPIRDTAQAIASEPEPGSASSDSACRLIPMTFQYLALVLSSEYLHSESAPDADTTDSLMAMVRRPGPGKWVGFIREAARYFSEHPTTVLPEQGIRAVAASLVAKDRPRVKLQSGQRLDRWEALVTCGIGSLTRAISTATRRRRSWTSTWWCGGI